MSSSAGVARLYVLVLAVTVFFLVWATVAAHPWATAARPAVDPRIHAIAVRQQHLQAESLRVKRIVDARFAAYRRQLAARTKAAAAATSVAMSTASVVTATPSVRVVNLPPLVVTRTS